MRLSKGVRLLNPFSGTYYKYGGRFVTLHSWTEKGQVIISMKMHAGERGEHGSLFARIFFIVEPEDVGLQRRHVVPVQQLLFH